MVQLIHPIYCPCLLQGNTALMIAAAKGHTDIILNLLRYGANRDAVNDEASVCTVLFCKCCVPNCLKPCAVGFPIILSSAYTPGSYDNDISQ